jgi:hypothetical protein
MARADKTAAGAGAASNSETATIQVVALRDGYYNHIYQVKGSKFTLRPVRMANGEILTAERQFSGNRIGENGKPVRGWMKRLGEGPAAQAAPPPLVPQTKALGLKEKDDDGAQSQGGDGKPADDSDDI